jgi:hypothetical protein
MITHTIDGSAFACCPVCSRSIPLYRLNQHIDNDCDKKRPKAATPSTPQPKTSLAQRKASTPTQHTSHKPMAAWLSKRNAPSTPTVVDLSSHEELGDNNSSTCTTACTNTESVEPMQATHNGDNTEHFSNSPKRDAFALMKEASKTQQTQSPTPNKKIRGKQRDPIQGMRCCTRTHSFAAMTLEDVVE